MKITENVKKILANYEGENTAVRSNLYKMLMTGKLAGTGKMVIEPVAVKQSGCVSKPIAGSAGNSFIVRITGVLVNEGQVPLKASAK